MPPLKFSGRNKRNIIKTREWKLCASRGSQLTQGTSLGCQTTLSGAEYKIFSSEMAAVTHLRDKARTCKQQYSTEWLLFSMSRSTSQHFYKAVQQFTWGLNLPFWLNWPTVMPNSLTVINHFSPFSPQKQKSISMPNGKPLTKDLRRIIASIFSMTCHKKLRKARGRELCCNLALRALPPTASSPQFIQATSPARSESKTQQPTKHHQP